MEYLSGEILCFLTKVFHLKFILSYKTLKDVRVQGIEYPSEDLNAKVENYNRNWKKVIECHGLGNTNQNGELLA